MICLVYTVVYYMFSGWSILQWVAGLVIGLYCRGLRGLENYLHGTTVCIAVRGLVIGLYCTTPSGPND